MSNLIESLFMRARNGDLAAEQQLFEQLAVRFRLFARLKVQDLEYQQDIVQDALVTVAGKYRGLIVESSFAAWAHQVLHFQILRYYRKKAAQMSREEEMTDISSAGQSFQPDLSLRSQLLDCLRKINRTNRRYARILNFHYQGYTVQEVCERLRITRNHYYVVLSRSRSMLEKCLDEGANR